MLLTSIISVILTSHVAYACNCMQPLSPDEELPNFEAVFSGIATTNQDWAATYNISPAFYTFDVDRGMERRSKGNHNYQNSTIVSWHVDLILKKMRNTLFMPINMMMIILKFLCAAELDFYLMPPKIYRNWVQDIQLTQMLSYQNYLH